MSTINYINVSLEAFSCVMVLAVTLCMIMSRQIKTKRGRLYLVMLVCNAALQFFGGSQVSGLIVVNLTNTISLTLIFFFLQTEFGRREAEQQKQIAEQENQLAQSRIAMMRSQINPHFIYNTLGTIQYFCKRDPEKAAYIVQEFSMYLRGNFGELETKHPVTVSKELKHTEHYTDIERIRFPDMKVVYELNAKDFMLPALSVQPLVENAINHGLMGRQIGGTVKITTYHTKTAYCVKVEEH